MAKMANEQTAMEYYFFGVEEKAIEMANRRSNDETETGTYWRNVLDLLTYLYEEAVLYKDISEKQRDWLKKIQEDLT